MAKDLIFESKPKKSAIEKFLNEDLPPVIDVKLYSMLLPTDKLKRGDEFFDELNNRWFPTHAVGCLVKTQTHYYRRKNF